MKHLFLSIYFAAFACCANAFSPYIKKIYDYSPAPGQFINLLPEYEEGDTQADMQAKCLEYIGGTSKGAAVSLGAWGGYIIFGFDHPIINSGNDYDFKVYGNTFANEVSAGRGSAEPGIVMVSYDANNNGVPDDEWYQLKGSEYGNADTFSQMSITYHSPLSNRPLAADPDPDDKGVCDRSYIPWSSNYPQSPNGYIQRVTFHTQPYWPQWIKADSLSFSGTRLPSNVVKMDNGQYQARFFDWGYADNQPDELNPGFKISDAVDANGNMVNLYKIHFVKVYTAVCQTCGSLGEGSTEITGAEDLHPDMYDNVAALFNDTTKASIYNIQGQLIDSYSNPEEKNNILSRIPAGIYIIKTSNSVDKIYNAH